MRLLRRRSKGKFPQKTSIREILRKISMGQNNGYDTFEIFAKDSVRTTQLCSKHAAYSRVEFSFKKGGKLVVNSKGKLYMMISYNENCHRINIIAASFTATTYEFSGMEIYCCRFLKLRNSHQYFENTILFDSQ